MREFSEREKCRDEEAVPLTLQVVRSHNDVVLGLANYNFCVVFRKGLITLFVKNIKEGRLSPSSLGEEVAETFG